MLLGILKETAPGETRVALLPESLKGLLAQGITVVVESGAGNTAGASDEAYAAAGASVTGDRPSILGEADLLPVVNAPSASDQALLKSGAVVIGFLRPLDAPSILDRAARHALQYGAGAADQSSTIDGRTLIDGHCCRLQGCD